MKITAFSCKCFFAFVSLLSLLVAYSRAESDAIESASSPYSIAVFNIPDKYREILTDYRSRWSRVSGFQFSGLHWNQFVSVYTDIGASVYENNHRQFLRWYDDPDDEDNEPHYQGYPVGSVLLKENYTSDRGSPGEPLSLAIMIKQPAGFAAEHGDWLFLQVSPAGEILLEGSYKNPAVNSACAACHDNVGDRDFIFSSMYTSRLAHEQVK